MFSRIILLFVVSQLYWAWRGYLWLSKRVRSFPQRVLISLGVVALHIVLFQMSLGSWRAWSQPVRLTWHEVLIEAPYLWWMATSIVGFLLAAILWVPRG